MREQFDPYHVWLGIPPEEQPPHHYRLLGIKPFEDNPEVIENAADQKVIHLRTFQLSKYRELAERLLNEVAAAKVCLHNAATKAVYDEQLRTALNPPQSLPVGSPADAKSGGRGRWVAGLGTAVVLSACGGLLWWSLAGGRRPVSPAAQVASAKPNDVLVLPKTPSGPEPAQPKLEPVKPKPEPATAKHEPVKPKPEPAQPKPEPAKPKPEPAKPKPEPVKPKPAPPEAPNVPVSPERPPLAAAPFGAREAKLHQQRWSACLHRPVEERNSIGMPLVLIPPGEFEMGSTIEEIAAALKEGRKNEEMSAYAEYVPTEGPRHRVKITRPFYLGMYPVTQAEYAKVMDVNPSGFTQRQADLSAFQPPLLENVAKARVSDRKSVAGKHTGRHPVETVSWDDAVEFCRRLSALPAERAAQRVYRLPTEAEWEYACRAGTASRWFSGDDDPGLVDVAWFRPNSGGMTHPVGQKKPNAWGLHDMQGNVCQWCADWFSPDYYRRSPASDPDGPAAGSTRVCRGASSTDRATRCRSAFHQSVWPAHRSHYFGFRVAAEP
jgi:formylglycine-generating enzyme required for sulfatase activity